MQKGTNHSDESRSKMSSTRKGRTMSEEQKAKIRLSLKKYWMETEGTFLDEHRSKLGRPRLNTNDKEI